MIIQAVFMSLTLVLLLFIAHTQWKTYLVAQVTLVSFLGFLEAYAEEEDEDYGETQQFH